MTNLNNELIKFFIFAGIVILVAQIALAYGQFVSAIAPANTTTTDMAGPLTIPFMIFGGYFLNNETTPKYFLWIRYLSWFNYANEALVVNQWHGVTDIGCHTDPILCFMDGESILNYLNMKMVKKASDIIIQEVYIKIYIFFVIKGKFQFQCDHAGWTYNWLANFIIHCFASPILQEIDHGQCFAFNIAISFLEICK
jgi:hypothetical protein